jgi:hypothetical protein
MRSMIVAVVLGLGCYVPPAVSPNDPDAIPEVKTHRPLVTDQLPYHLERSKVREWHLGNGWCMRRTWPSTDEFVICNPEYLNLKTPPMYAMARYDADGGTIAYATFTPVPCRMYGRCDAVPGRTVYASEHDFVDHSNGLDDRLVDRGRADGNSEIELPSMQVKMFDALAAELRRRFGAPQWQDPHRFGATWATQTSEIGLFVAGRGGWVVETHELRGAPP